MKRVNPRGSSASKKRAKGDQDVSKVPLSDIRIKKVLTYFSNESKDNKAKIEQAAADWFTELDKCQSKNESLKGDWITGFEEIIEKSKLNQSAPGFARFVKKDPHPVVRCLFKGILVQEEMQKCILNVCYKPSYFEEGDASMLSTFWNGLLGNALPPPVQTMIPDVKSEIFVPPMILPETIVDLRLTVIQKERQNPLLKSPYKKFASFFKIDERNLIVAPHNYLKLAQKVSSLIVAYALHFPDTCQWTDKTRNDLLSGFTSTFIKEGAPLIVSVVVDEKIITSYVEDHKDESFGMGTKVRQDISGELKKVLEKPNFKSTNKGARFVAQCFSRRRIADLKKLLN